MNDYRTLKTIADRYTLSNGETIPCVGLGTAGLKDSDETVELVKAALGMGYRHIDTAAAYGNEAAVGRAIRESEIPRSEIFLTTKLDGPDHGYQKALDACQASLDRLGLDYVDLYLIHWPRPEESYSDWQEANRETWRAFAKLIELKKIRSAGISNFHARHIDALLEGSDLKSSVNQIKLCPGVTQPDVVDYSRRHDMILTAYSPLDRGEILAAKPVMNLARKYGKTAAQVVLRWSLEMGFVPLPKSSNRDRLAENMDLFDFELTEDERTELTELEGYAKPASDPDS